MKQHTLVMGLLFFLGALQKASAVEYLTLSDFSAFAENFAEKIPDENDNLVDPLYARYHTALAPSVWRSLMEFFRIEPAILVSQSYLEELLEVVVAQRKKRVNLEEHLMSLKTPESAHVICWGGIRGAVHSWIRCLEELKRQEIIDDTLKIIKPEYYFCILGNALEGSPYLIETLVLAITLLMKNPDRVFYLKGDFNEGPEAWRTSSLAREINLRMPRLMKNSSLISRFLDSLPLALYISGEDASEDLIRFSHTGRADERIDLGYMGNFFLHAQGERLRRFYHRTTTKTKTENNPTVKAIVKGNPGNEVVARMSKGLTLLEPDHGATAWLVRSSPTVAQQAMSELFYDAYVDVAVGKTIEETTIALFNRDMRDPQSAFTRSAVYNIVSGQRITDALDQSSALTQTINLGSTMALTRGVSVMGERVKRGMSVALSDINSAGGIRGALLRPYVLDDEYTPRLARQNIERLLQKGITVDILPIGSPTLESYLDLIKTGSVFVFFPVTGGPQFRDPALKNIIHFRPSYTEEARALMTHFVDTYGARRFAFFYQDDGYGRGPLGAAHALLKERGISEWLDVSYNRTDVIFKEKARQIQEYQPEVIVLFSTGNQTRELIRQLGVDTLVNKWLAGISFLAEDSFKRYVRQRGLMIAFAQIVPNPAHSDLPIVREYRAAMDAQRFEYDTFSLEGYIATRLYCSILEKQEGTAPAEVMQALEAVRDRDFGGIPLSFDPQKRELSHTIWLELNTIDWKEVRLPAFSAQSPELVEIKDGK
jgi:ABC-type branched-subunit amino acid transport system substrate-binding protein